jgi:N6-adenosine-specific RNA methylase IME4
MGLGLDATNYACEIKLKAQRRMGEIVRETELNKGRPRKNGTGVGTVFFPTTLADLGINKKQSSRYQAIAIVPTDVFEAHIAQTKANGLELTTAGMLAIAHEINREQKYAAMQTPGHWPIGQYRVIYADPPWPYERNEAGVLPTGGRRYGRAECHYPTMSIEDLCAMGEDVRAISYKETVLFLWATVPLLPEALDVMSAWGFTYKTHYVWNKVRHNMGYYSSVRHESLLIGTRGSCVPEGQKQNSIVTVERTNEHSQKPAEFRQLIDTLYPYGPRIELFARGELSAHWRGWGNEALR